VTLSSSTQIGGVRIQIGDFRELSMKLALHLQVSALIPHLSQHHNFSIPENFKKSIDFIFQRARSR
jgi:hypothetical protein